MVGGSMVDPRILSWAAYMSLIYSAGGNGEKLKGAQLQMEMQTLAFIITYLVLRLGFELLLQSRKG